MKKIYFLSLCLLVMASCSHQLEDVGGKSPIVRFNPSTLQWSYCTKEGDIFHPIKNSPLLTLSLNGAESRID
ncbi:MAG: hypothetical protein IKN84_05325 [Bacteroidales bacterium]|nr:hypothetical protein [Bacteroidales bacterium]